MKRIVALFLILGLLSPCYAFSFKKNKKKKKEKLPPMVQTVDEWMEAATAPKMDMRKRQEDISEEDKKYIEPKRLPSYLLKYNKNAGTKELDLTHILKYGNIRTYPVSDSSFNNAVYTESYYYPQTRQVASTFYLIELDKHLSDKEKLEDVSIFEHTRYPLISTALPYLKEGFYSTLTLVDFSKTGKEILVKEKRGSNKFGLYETYVWIYYLTDESKEDSEAYINNLDFEKNGFDFEEEPKYVSENGFEIEGEEYNVNLNNLKPSPDKAPSANADEKTNGINLDNLNESLIKKTLKEEDMPKLTYDDLNSYIKSVWKDSNVKPSNKTRWYNNAPKDFTVETPNYEREKIGYGVRLNLLNETIKAYWLDKQKLLLNHIRWDLKPLGFSSDEIITEAFAYGTDGKKISLGRWAVNIKDGLPRLIAEDENISIEANAIYVERGLEAR